MTTVDGQITSDLAHADIRSPVNPTPSSNLDTLATVAQAEALTSVDYSPYSAVMTTAPTSPMV